MENVLRQTLYGDPETPSAGIAGTAQNDAMDSVGQMIHTQQYGIAPPSNIPAPVRKKILSVEEVEEFLAKRRRERLITMGLDLIAGARPAIRQAAIKDAIQDFPQHADKLRLLQ